MAIVNAKKIINNAFKNKYAIPHINVNNLEWAKAILTTCEEKKSPVIIGASSGAIRYMGGYKTVYNLINSLHEHFDIKIPVVIHLDHGTFEGAIEALENGFTSIMFDGSQLEFKENKEKSQKIIQIAKKFNASVEIEIGSIGGEEDDIISSGELVDLSEFKIMFKLEPDMIAVGIGNIHGKYPKNWKELNWEILSKLNSISDCPLVLHGGSGIPTNQIKRAIKMGVSKVNINTELQIANAKAIKEFIISGEIDKDKNFDPRKLLNPGYKAMKEIIAWKIDECGSKGKA